MPLTLTQSVKPAIFPVDLDAMKEHLRLDTDEEDALIQALIGAATSHTEKETHRQLITATWELRLDRFPRRESAWRLSRQMIRLPRPPAQSVTSITYVDRDGATQTLATSTYQVDVKTEPARVMPAYNQYWPDTRYETLNAVTMTYLAGYGDTPADVPDGLVVAIKFLVAHWYEHREVVAERQRYEVPMTFDLLIYDFIVPQVV